ncbi:hypothetical protein B8W66_23495 [Mycobacterium decipiens]|uniref:Uncharacterized protein n=1 Tax=Mycobacterium decipiens TaxID=1430326 RepID=A0A1X2LKZ7_9MYCO|nr:hypothetical protein B8W66_23495 [Mycobacterium decipiens]
MTVGAVGGDQSAGLDGVTEGGAGAVGLHHIDVIELQAGVGERLGDDALLSGPIRGAQSVRRTILVDR